MKSERFTPSRKLTRWYPASIKPVRVGYYQASIFQAGNNDAPRMLWNGEAWWNPYTERLCIHQDRVWRGLARKP